MFWLVNQGFALIHTTEYALLVGGWFDIKNPILIFLNFTSKEPLPRKDNCEQHLEWLHRLQRVGNTRGHDHRFTH